MIPLLYNSNFSDKILGKFTETISCFVVEELNGAFELNMTILRSDPNLPNLKIGSIIVAKPNQIFGNQPFVVEQIVKNFDGTVGIYATHIAQYRSKLIPVKPFTANSLANALSGIITNSVENNPFTLDTDKTVASNFSLSEPRSMRDVLGGVEGSILDIYKGEYFYNGFNITLMNKRGRTDSHIKVMYGANMVEYNQTDEFNWSQSITGILPFYKKTENNAETVVVGDVQYSDYADYYSYKKTIPYDFSTDFGETVPTKAQLNTKAQAFLNGKGMPTVSFNVSFEDISTLPAYRNIYEQVSYLQLGDKVDVINSQYNTNFSSRIRRLEYDVLLERYSTIQIGDQVSTINDAIGGVIASTNSNEFTSYSAGTGIDITNNVISTDLQGGTGINVTDDVITNTALDATLRYLDSSYDLDNVLEEGIYQCYNCSNIPSGTNGVLIVIKVSSSNTYRQIFFRQGTINSNDYNWFSRQITANTKGDWVQMYNDKSLTGGDGITISNGTVTNDYTYKAGDTVTLSTWYEVHGLCGGTATTAYLSIPLHKTILASSVTFTKLQISVYSNGTRTLSNTNVIGGSYGVTATLDKNMNAINVTITGLPTMTRYSPIAIELASTTSFKFS